jgi:hypothetical protein
MKFHAFCVGSFLIVFILLSFVTDLALTIVLQKIFHTYLPRTIFKA